MKNGALVKKSTIHDCGQEWDLIVFNHSFEHLPDPLESLQAAARLLSKDGVCLIRIPTVLSHAWRYYGVDWVQLDAPRHFFLHSLESIKMLSAMSGFYIFDIFFDSTEFQFVGSEMYRRNIPRSSGTQNFSDAEIDQYRSLAEQLNRENQRDQAAFYLKRLHPVGYRT
jgi:SAM-dependent methyltransferase